MIFGRAPARSSAGSSQSHVRRRLDKLSQWPVWGHQRAMGSERTVVVAKLVVRPADVHAVNSAQ
eukprot:scaffold15375_cov26-Tisochrysis_lutea.AAC.3